MRSLRLRKFGATTALIILLPSVAEARFLQTDPVGYNDQVNLYAYVGNDPINQIDPSGKVIVVQGPIQWEAETYRDINIISSKPGGAEFVQSLRESPMVIKIVPVSNASVESRGLGNQAVANDDTKARNGAGTGSTVYFDPKVTAGGVDSSGSNQRPSFVGLGHELGHAEDNANGTKTGGYSPSQPGSTPPIEQNSVKRENQIREEHRLPSRPSYFPCKKDASGAC